MKGVTQPRLVHYVETSLSQAIGSMTGRNIAVALDPGAPDLPALENGITWQQTFSVIEGPSFWIAAGKDLWEALGKITLEAAGIEEVTEVDCRSTWQEILNQTFAGVATSMTADQAREITAVKGAEVEASPPVLPGWFFQSPTGAKPGRSKRAGPRNWPISVTRNLKIRVPQRQEIARFPRRSTYCWKLRCLLPFRSAGPLCRFAKS